MSSSVAELKSLLHDQPANPLRPQQVAEYQDEADRNRKIAEAPPWHQGDRSGAIMRHGQLQRLLRDQAPKPIEEPMRRDQVAKLAQQVLDEEIRPRMLTRVQMRRNPAGAVDAFIKRENGRQTKDAILTWKRAQRALEPENEDQDFTNLERFRPEGMNPNGTSTYMSDAQIPGVHAMTPQAKANWPLGEPTIETPVKTAQKREMSEAQKAALLRAQAARRDKAAEKRAASGASTADVA